VEPGAVIQHCAKKVFLVLSVRTGNPTAVLATDINRQAECHLGYPGAVLAVRVIVFDEQAVVFVDACDLRPVDRRSGADQRSGGGIEVAAVLRLAQRIDSTCSATSCSLAVQVVL